MKLLQRIAAAALLSLGLAAPVAAQSSPDGYTQTSTVCNTRGACTRITYHYELRWIDGELQAVVVRIDYEVFPSPYTEER